MVVATSNLWGVWALATLRTLKDPQGDIEAEYKNAEPFGISGTTAMITMTTTTTSKLFWEDALKKFLMESEGRGRQTIVIYCLKKWN